jgi:hypothetical protein
MSTDPTNRGSLSATGAQKIEYGIIGLGIVALLLIFQPFSLSLFTVGAVVVVIAGLVNNMLPMAQPGVSKRSFVTVAMVVAMIFGIVILLSILVAFLYGSLFLAPPIEGTQAARVMAKATKWYAHPFTISVAVITAVLAALITLRARKKQ